MKKIQHDHEVGKVVERWGKKRRWDGMAWVYFDEELEAKLSKMSRKQLDKYFLKLFEKEENKQLLFNWVKLMYEDKYGKKPFKD